ncbi:MAG: helix-turn-helix domain-containing protein [Candidatus Latescibacterota bacterium]|nr:helix-turn-helix domain-containing protein [Candidatus Latescibacterota bacterium]
MDELIAELKSHRERLGLSLQDVFKKTRINVAFLEALEEGNFEILPDAYVKLFLKRYAQEVKLDGDEIVQKFEKLDWQAPAAEVRSTPGKSEGLPRWAMSVVAVVFLGLVALQSQTDHPSVPVAASKIQTTANLEKPGRVDPQVLKPTEAGPIPSQTANSPQEMASATDIVITPTINTTPAPIEEQVDDPPLPPIVQVQESSDKDDSRSTETVAVSKETRSEPADYPSAEPAAESGDGTPVKPLSEPVVSGYSLSLSQDLTRFSGTLSLTAEVLEATRITVTSDGEPVFDEKIFAGRRTGWEARDRFIIEIQQGAAVVLRLMNEKLPRVGSSGQKVRLFVSRSSIWVEEIEASNLTSSTSDRP